MPEWVKGAPCPKCGKEMIEYLLYWNDEGAHQHTRYICTYWPTGGDRCGWMGWIIPEEGAEHHTTEEPDTDPAPPRLTTLTVEPGQVVIHVAHVDTLNIRS